MEERDESYTPLMLDKIVALATLVSPRPTLSDQFARNQRGQNTDARRAVSRVVRRGRATEADSGGASDERRCGLFELDHIKNDR
jgi:hypothetical protein